MFFKANKYPTIPLNDQVVFPGNIVQLTIGRDYSLSAVEYARKNLEKVLLVLHKPQSDKEKLSFYRVGCLASIVTVKENRKDKTKNVTFSVRERVIMEATHIDEENRQILSTVKKFPYTVDGVKLDDTKPLMDLFEQYLCINPAMEVDSASLIPQIKNPVHKINSAVGLTLMSSEKKQEVLEQKSLRLALSAAEKNIRAELGAVEEKVIQAELNRGGLKSYDLLKDDLASHEKMKLEEDGPLDEGTSGPFRPGMKMPGGSKKKEDKLAKLYAEKELPAEIGELVKDEMERLSSIPNISPEYSQIYSYLEWMLNLPWSERAEVKNDIELAEKVLSKDHYGMKKAKQKVLEHLAVQMLSERKNGMTLCFLGPPGVGKTSLGQSIAEATGREFQRISLGGVKDENEIRGHRRTYVGAMPGKIIQALRKAKTKNPVILLDEIDKLGSDWRGDPSSAMLEVLDPAQNSTFQDHYINQEFDLSEVLFICTANDAQTIPGPLRDRMDFVVLSGYLEDEKVEIANRHLIPRQMSKTGINKEALEFTANSIKEMIGGYTMEAGVRNLERVIGDVCKKTALKLLKDKDYKVKLTKSNLKTVLGNAPIRPEKMNLVDQKGLVNGLAWSSVGGSLLQIETVLMSGSGQLKVTGNLGDVMRESAMAARSYVQSIAEDYGIPQERFDNFDIHIHVPAGATPKDGPSAGITMTTAIFSAVTQRAVKSSKYAMTGEISLTGRVMPVGGIREKVIAAYKEGIREVFLPKANEPDVKEIPKKIREKMTFRFPVHASEVLDLAIDWDDEKVSDKNKVSETEEN